MYKIEAVKDGKTIKTEYVIGTYSDAESVMFKFLREGYRCEAGYSINIKDVR